MASNEGAMPLRTVTRAALLVAAAMTAAVCFSGDVLGATHPVPTTEVIITLKGAPLSGFGRTIQSASHATYTRQLEAARESRLAESSRPCLRRACAGTTTSSQTASPSSSPVPQLAALARVPGVDRVWPNVHYHSLRAAARPEQIGADDSGGRRSLPRGTA